MTPARTSKGSTGWKRFLVPAAALCVVFVAAGPAPAVLLPTFTANSTVDLPDVNPGDGICVTVLGDCSLRAAVQEASARSGNLTTINLLAGTTYTLTELGPNEDQAVKGDLDLGQGPGLHLITITVPGGRAVVQGAPGWNDRIFDVQDGGVVVLNALDIRGGNLEVAGDGGGIRNRGALRVTNGAVSGNAAPGSAGISNSGRMTLVDSIVSLNRSHDGGGISNVGTLEVTNSNVSGNSARSEGGGIWNAGMLTVTNSTVSFNSAAEGAGVFTRQHGPFSMVSQVILTGSTISQNTTQNSSEPGGQREGGGVFVDVGASLFAANSTISTNSAATNGGGIYNLGTTFLRSVTIADNVADVDGNGRGDGGGVFNVSGGTVSVANTIVGDNVDASGASKFPDCLGSLGSFGYNLVENTSGCTIGAIGDFSDPDITGRDPRLGPLQSNGGPTFTHALLLGEGKSSPSPAIDGGFLTGAGQTCSQLSQNGVSRPVDGNADGIARCDIGAYELPRQKFPLGTWALTPAAATARTGESNTYSLTWTVPAPLGWRSLDTLQLRFVDRGQTALWIRFQEIPGSPGLFSVIDSQTGEAGRSFAPGSRKQLKGDAAKLDLATTAVDGPPGSRVTLQLSVSFKGRAARHTYDVQVLATDDSGATQGFHRAGTVTVARGERDDDSDRD